MSENKTIEIESVDTVDVAEKIIEPAKDRVLEDALETMLSDAGRERVVPMEIKSEYMEDSRYGDRWHMQKAICLILEDFAGEITVNELAFVIDQWFDKPNYGFGRAKTDVAKFRNKVFKCQHFTAVSGVEAA